MSKPLAREKRAREVGRVPRLRARMARPFSKPKGRPPMCRPLSPASAARFVALVAVLAVAGPARAQTTYYWDANGTSTAAVAATGTWGTSAFWTTDSSGAAAGGSVAWVAGSNAVFSAGTNGTG